MSQKVLALPTCYRRRSTRRDRTSLSFLRGREER